MLTLSSQKYSRYLPVCEKLPTKSSHRKTSIAKATETKSTKEKDKSARAAAAAAAADSLTKRRSTMNSRAAYDEEEVLRKILEESKTEVEKQDTSSRKGKRSRDESEE
jgi:hypothetical protein